ncbi:MAG TPA: hypothetical protein DCL77_17625 [Prolixibacteraceae bacterium]|jgi:glycogen debranching enzyme|nr:hypothetical protein [Prolixibacteraceae bacterium]
MKSITGILCLLMFSWNNISCGQTTKFQLYEASKNLPHIFGKPQNSNYLYVTAGNRLYCIGNQKGEFPQVGFHVPGEMGGIWQQPIKLLDGFKLTLINSKTGLPYTSVCDSFVTCSMATKFHYQLSSETVGITQTQFVPDNLPVLVVEYTIRNNSIENKDFDLELTTDINLMPVWLGERGGMIDSQDSLASFDKKRAILYFRDKSNTWYTGIGFENDPVQFKGLKKTAYKGKGVTGITILPCQLPAGKSFNFRFYISGSLSGIGEIDQNISAVRSKLLDLFYRKENRYAAIAKTAEIIVPDQLLQTAYNWGKYATDWLVRDVPSLGHGLSAGLPDYPWFFSNDQASTFMALTGIVSPTLFYDSYSMLKRISDQVNDSCGRIIHEVSSNGVVYDKGRMEESQLHIIAAWQIFKWTGDLQFLKENYAFAKRTWKWLQQHDTNNNGYIEGYGGVEIEGLNEEMLDVQVNTYLFLDILSQMASLFNEKEDASKYAKKAATLKDNINKDWWIDNENRYADFITTKEKALKIIDDALAKRVKKGRNDWAEVKLNQLKDSINNNTYPYKGYVVYYNSSGMQPMLDGMTDTTRAIHMLKSASFFNNKFGTYIAGIERPDNITLDEGKFKKDTAFNYNGAVMPAATAGLALAAARYGMPDTSLIYIHKILNSFSYATPGTMYEISPDYGMFVQAWNVTGINIPLIQYFFGIQPDAYKKEINLHIQMPTAWDHATLNNLIVGNTRLSVQYTKIQNRVKCIIRSTEPGWKIHFVVDKNSSNIVLNNETTKSYQQRIELTGLDNTIQYTIK